MVSLLFAGFAGDRYSPSAPGSGSPRRPAAENLARDRAEGEGMPVNVVNRILRNLCVIYGDLRRAVYVAELCAGDTRSCVRHTTYTHAHVRARARAVHACVCAYSCACTRPHVAWRALKVRKRPSPISAAHAESQRARE